MRSVPIIANETVPRWKFRPWKLSTVWELRLVAVDEEHMSMLGGGCEGDVKSWGCMCWSKGVDGVTGGVERRIFWEVAVAGMQSEKVVRHERLRRISQLVTNLAWGFLVGYRMRNSRRMNAPTHCQTNLPELVVPAPCCSHHVPPSHGRVGWVQDGVCGICSRVAKSGCPFLVFCRSASCKLKVMDRG